MSPASAEQVARRAGLEPRVALDWLCACAATGYVRYEADAETFELTPAARVLFADEDDPRCLLSMIQAVKSVFDDEERATRAVREGRRLAWGERSPGCFCGTDRAFGPAYAKRHVSDFLPAMDGVAERPAAGGLAGDVGCGQGSALRALVRAFPRSRFRGFDMHPRLIEVARERAAAAGLEIVSFEVADAGDLPLAGFDLLCVFDALHDMGDPEGAVARTRRALTPTGRLMVLQARAGDRPEDNLHLTGAIYYSLSTRACVLASKAEPVGLALGAQAGPGALEQVLRAGGFDQVRRIAATPTKLVLEAC